MPADGASQVSKLICVPGTGISPSMTETVPQILATCVIAMRALLITDWEEAASLATWASRIVSSQASRFGWDEGLSPYGLSTSELQWVLNCINAW